MALCKEIPVYLFLLASGCGKNSPQTLIEQWNGDFQAKKTACENGDQFACKQACQMSITPKICDEVRAVANMDNPQERDWVMQCASNAARQAAAVCEAAAALPSSSDSSAENSAASKILSEIDELQKQFEGAQQQENALKEALLRAREAAEEAKRKAETAAGNLPPVTNTTKLEPVQVIGGLSKDDVLKVTETKHAALRACYERRLNARPDLTFRITVNFIISDTGRVQAAAVRNSNAGDPQLERCVVSVIRRLVFPAPKDGVPVIVAYPFVLSSQ